MSVTQSRPEDCSKKEIACSGLPAVDTNAILRKVVQQLPPAARSTMILRCDELPQVYAREENMAAAFSRLFELVSGQKEKKILYLHITSSCLNEESKETGNCKVQFHTNLASNEWLENNNQKVNYIAALLTPFGGCVTINQLKNSGCIFALSLPAKQ